MSEPKFTPGPWEIGYGRGVTGKTCPRLGGATVGGKNRNEEIITVPDNELGDETYSSVVAILPGRGAKTTKANAKLIAASPEYYRLLKKAMFYVGGPMRGETKQQTIDRLLFFGEIKAALKKAAE